MFVGLGILIGLFSLSSDPRMVSAAPMWRGAAALCIVAGSCMAAFGLWYRKRDTA